jgi:hypothetical protein
LNPIAEDILQHYGIARRSGRYPWGSGDDPYQRNGDFISRVVELKKSGLSEAEIAEAVGLRSTSQLRAAYSNASNERRIYDIERCKSMKGDGYTPTQISKKTGLPEATVRSLLNPESEARTRRALVLTNLLRDQVEAKGMIDVGEGVEISLNASRPKMEQALEALKAEGYVVLGGRMDQATNAGRKTTNKVLALPGTAKNAVYDLTQIQTIDDYIIREDADGNDVAEKAFVYPKSIDSSRIAVNYAENGGALKDGVVELRRGVPDLSLGNSHYAQVRILVDGDKYIKGMAVYSDNIPEGADILFNTNKSVGTPIGKVLKAIDTKDPDNPFGSLIKPSEKGGQSYYLDENGNRVLSAINKTRDEGDWNDWRNGLPAQFLSKQPMKLMNQQLDLAIADKRQELDDILALTNPTVKKVLLESFAEDCDSAALHLRAAALPRQKYQVILPINALKDNEVYAPNFEDGETVALIRFPHGGTFEIPVLRVNKKNETARSIIDPLASDAIGINSNVAKQLSGADFDGDTVMVVPCNSATSSVRIKADQVRPRLRDFDPKAEYKYNDSRIDPDGTEHLFQNGVEFKRMPKGRIQAEMGIISNLITDMTIKGASLEDPDLENAVRHSMVVIDAWKHGLNYKKSEADHNIAALKKRYQGHIGEDGRYHEGASTLISLSKSEVPIPKRVGAPRIDPKTGEVTYNTLSPEKSTYLDKSGKIKTRMQKEARMNLVRDAHDLSSGTLPEEAYANFANSMKSLANESRKIMMATGDIEYSASAKETYKEEVSSLTAKLNRARLNAPRERHAQRLANINVKAKKEANDDLTKADLKKIAQQELKKARDLVGAKRSPVSITPREWDAIQSGAIHKTLLGSILQNADIDIVRQLATPRASNELSSSKIARIKTMALSGYDTAAIAKAVGCSTSAVLDHVKK